MRNDARLLSAGHIRGCAGSVAASWRQTASTGPPGCCWWMSLAARRLVGHRWRSRLSGAASTASGAVKTCSSQQPDGLPFAFGPHTRNFQTEAAGLSPPMPSASCTMPMSSGVCAVGPRRARSAAGDGPAGRSRGRCRPRGNPLHRQQAPRPSPRILRVVGPAVAEGPYDPIRWATSTAALAAAVFFFRLRARHETWHEASFCSRANRSAWAIRTSWPTRSPTAFSTPASPRTRQPRRLRDPGDHRPRHGGRRDHLPRPISTTQQVVRDVIREVGYTDADMGIGADTCAVHGVRSTSKAPTSPWASIDDAEPARTSAPATRA